MMTLKSYGDAIVLLSIAREHVPQSEKSKMVHYFIEMAINGLTDCINDELQFREPSHPVCDCKKGEGPKFGEEEAYYEKFPIRDALTRVRST